MHAEPSGVSSRNEGRSPTTLLLAVTAALLVTACGSTIEQTGHDAAVSSDAWWHEDAAPPDTPVVGDGAGGGIDGAGSDAPPPGPETTATFRPTTEVLPNPERGFYGWSGSDFVTRYDSAGVRAAFDAGQRLVLAAVDLGAYRTSDLPATFLSALGDRFDAVREAGMKTTLLFAYDFTSEGNDATALQIQRHLEQLRDVLAAHADLIPYMRAGFIGAWGEWHSSKSGNSCGYNSGTTPCDVAAANRLIVRDALLANVPPSTQIAFRYPLDLIAWYPDPHQQRRAGMHNDCFLAGPTDTGTYPTQAERDYAMALTENASFGGETCENAEVPLRTSCADILAEGASYHLAWLNDNYAPTFLDRWRTDGCYDEVAATMGYRLELVAVAHPERARRGGAVPVKLDLRNAGWARMFGQPRPLVAILRPRDGGASLRGASAAPLQELPAQSQTSTRIDVTVAIPGDAAPGAYEVLVAAPDPSPRLADDVRFAIRFANADDAAAGQRWDATAGGFVVGTTLHVE